jgi:UvrD/REP helicase N-terminal domain
MCIAGGATVPLPLGVFLILALSNHAGCRPDTQTIPPPLGVFAPKRARPFGNAPGRHGALALSGWSHFLASRPSSKPASLSMSGRRRGRHRRKGDSRSDRGKIDPACSPDNGVRRVSPDPATGIATLSRRCYRLQRTEKEHKAATDRWPAALSGLNPEQRRAVEYGIGEHLSPAPALLIAAGAGTGKTKTLAHRVAHLILNGGDPQRLLLLTFTRRAALEMTRRSQQILAEARGNAARGISTSSSLLP